MRTASPRIAPIIGALFLVVACAEPNRPPTAPSPPTPPTPPGPTTPSVTSLTVSGSTSIAAPGGTTQLTATARYSDDTTRDVTAEAQWSPSTSDPFTNVLTVISRGLIKAERYGKDGVRATYDSGPGLVASVSAEVRVAPDGVFLVSVVVSDGRWTVDGARVQVTSPAGTFSATTNLWGYVDLPATGNAVLQVEKAGFRTITKSAAVTSDQDFDFVLQPADGASSTVTR